MRLKKFSVPEQLGVPVKSVNVKYPISLERDRRTIRKFTRVEVITSDKKKKNSLAKM